MRRPTLDDRVQSVPTAATSGRVYERLRGAHEVVATDAGHRLADLALDKIRQGLCVFDGEQRLLLFNRRYAEMYSLCPEDLWIGMKLRDVVDLRYAAGTGPDMSKEAYATWRDDIQVADRVIETVVELRSGAVHEIHHEPMPGGGWVATFDDITERRLFEARIHHMAHHDALTGLPNRVLFSERLSEMVARFHESGHGGALLCLDLDGFKSVNDGFGHGAGDELLQQIAHRIQGQLGPSDTVARLGGDEFAVIAPDLEALDEGDVLASSISQKFLEPFQLTCGAVTVGISIGVALCSPGEEATAEGLLRAADRAMYRAKAGEAF